MTKYAILYFTTKKTIFGTELIGTDWGRWVIEKNHFTDIKEAEKIRIKILELAPELKVQNLQIVQYSE